MKQLCALALGLTMLFAPLSGCGSKENGAAANGTATIIEPAMIISQEDAKALTGVDFGACTVTEQPKVGLKLCVYDKGSSFLQVGLSQTAFMDEKVRKFGNTPESIYKTTKEAFKEAESLQGVGDDNFMAPPGLHILQGGYYLTISLGGKNSPDALKAAGLKAVDNLKKYSGQ